MRMFRKRTEHEQFEQYTFYQVQTWQEWAAAQQGIITAVLFINALPF